MANYVKGVEYGRSGSVKVDSDSETLVATVIADNKYYSPTQIAYTPGLPTVGGWFDFLGYVRTDLILESIDCQQDDDNAKVWHCTLTYNTKPAGDPNQDPSDQAQRENPLLRPADIKIGKRSISRVLDKCFDWSNDIEAVTDDMGNDEASFYVRNSAGDRFTDPPLEEEEWLRVYSITKNISVPDQLFIEDEYSDDVINTDAITIRGKLCEVATLRMSPPEFQIARGGPQGVYWIANFEVTYKKSTWIREVLDRGSRDQNGKPWTGTAIYGNEVANLDGAGVFLAAGADPKSLYIRTLLARPLAPLFRFWSQ
jgi:hypothetical protein